MLTGLGPDFNPVAASMLRDTHEVSLNEFYSHVLSYEALCAQQAQAPDEWVSSAKAASRPGTFSTSGQAHPYYPPANQGTGGCPCCSSSAGPGQYTASKLGRR